MVVLPSEKSINHPKSARKISLAINEHLDHPREDLVTDLVVDLHQIGWISSVGLNELIRIKHRSHASGVTLKLRSTSTELRDIFRMTRLDRIFDFEGDATTGIDEIEKSISG